MHDLHLLQQASFLQLWIFRWKLFPMLFECVSLNFCFCKLALLFLLSWALLSYNNFLYNPGFVSLEGKQTKCQPKLELFMLRTRPEHVIWRMSWGTARNIWLFYCMHFNNSPGLTRDFPCYFPLMLVWHNLWCALRVPAHTQVSSVLFWGYKEGRDRIYILCYEGE